MKLGIDTPWDPGSVMGLRFAAQSLRYAARRVIGHRYSSENYDPIVMKLGMDTHWDPGSVKGVSKVALRRSEFALRRSARNRS